MRSKSRSPTKLSQFLSIPRSETADYSRQGMLAIPHTKDSTIKKLCMNNNRISNLTGIENYQQLKELDLSNNNIKSWRQLGKITSQIQVLTVQGNPLQSQPNYIYNIVYMFPEIRKVNRLLMNQQLRKDIIMCQEVISQRLLHWIIQLNRMDQRLTNTFCSPLLSIQSMEDYNDAVEVLEKERKQLVLQFEPLFKFKDESIFLKNCQLKELLQRQEKISFSISEREAVQENFFQYLITLVTRSNKTIAEFLLSQITVNDQGAEKELVGNEKLMFKEMFYWFRKLWLQQTSSMSNPVLLEIEHNCVDVFPFYSLQHDFVEGVYQCFMDIIESNIKKIDESMEHVIRSQPRTLPVRRSMDVKYIADGMHRSSLISVNGLRRTRLHLSQEVTQRVSLHRKESRDTIIESHKDYFPLCKSLFSVIQNSSRRCVFERLTIFKGRVSVQKVLFAVQRLMTVQNMFIMFALKKLQQQNFQCRLIEKHYWNRRIKLQVFQGIRKLLYDKDRKLQILGSLIAKKERVTAMIMAYSFKRWKLMSSRTLRYIKDVRQSLDKKKHNNIEQQYQKIIGERLGDRRRSNTFHTRPVR